MVALDEDFIKQARKQAEEDKERMDLLRMLHKHPGWPYFVDLLNQALASRGAELLMPLSSTELNAVERSEHNKGAMYGITFSRDLLHVIVSADTEARKSEPAPEEDNQ
jgi:hypothetical protein